MRETPFSLSSDWIPSEAAPADSVCDNGQTGVQDPDTDVCCPLECGNECGGEGCGTIPSVEDSSAKCCANNIITADVTCDGAENAPCVQKAAVDANSTATCTSGDLTLPGIESAGVCCDSRCENCGGVNCGTTTGLSNADCCTAQIEANNELCSVTQAAPCVLDAPGEFVVDKSVGSTWEYPYACKPK